MSEEQRPEYGEPVFAEADLSDDKFLCGKLNLLQPIKGYRAATDAVLLAAACGAKSGESVLDLGCGAGAASLCLGWRVAGLDQAGLELQPEYADLAQKNGKRNNIALAVYQGSITHMPKELRRDFDHVIANPPYYPAGGTASPIDVRATAMQVRLPLAEWVAAATRRLRPGGYMTMISGADSVPELLSALAPKMGAATLLPLASREGREAYRVILRARKGAKGAFRMLAPLIIHRGEAHDGDRESYTQVANSILRDGAALPPEYS